MKKRVLIISAHADDHVMFAGTLFKLQESGYELHEVVMTDSREGGDKRKDSQKQTPDHIQILRQNEFTAASQFLGLQSKYLLGEEDLNLQYSKKLMLKLVEIIRSIKPKIIITLHKNDYHRDHRAVSKISQEAIFWAATSIRADLGRAHRTPTTLYSEGLQSQKVDVLVDVSAFYQKKLELFNFYLSQADLETIEILKSMMITRGYHLNNREQIEYAEGFSLGNKFPNLMFEDL